MARQAAWRIEEVGADAFGPAAFASVAGSAMTPVRPEWRTNPKGRPVDGMTDQRLGVLMAQHRGALLRYLRARGAGDEAEDMVQDVWIKVGAVDLDLVGEPRAYLYRVAHNVMLDRVRERRRRAERENVFHDLHDVGARPMAVVTSERELIAREHLARIEGTLARLGPRTDMIFRSHRVDGVGQREIAAELGVTLSAVEKQLQKAYRAIAAEERAYQDDRKGGGDVGR